jgi:hypothetical protein
MTAIFSPRERMVREVSLRVRDWARPRRDSGVTSLELLAKEAECRVNIVARFVEDLDESKLPFSNLNAYLEGHVGLHVHFRHWRRGPYSQCYCAVLDKVADLEVVACRDADSALREAQDEGKNEPVFVLCVQFVQEPEGVRLGFIPSRVVRLQRLDLCQYARTHPARLGGSVFHEPVSVFEDRKLSPTVWGAAVDEDKLPGQVVQGTSEIVQDFAQKDTPANRVGLGVEVDPPAMFRAIRIFLGHNLMGAAYRELTDLNFQILGLLISPPDLFENAV